MSPRLLLASTLIFVALGCSSRQRTEEVPAEPKPKAGLEKSSLLEPATATVFCTADGDLDRVEYWAPGYDKMAESMGSTLPTFEWTLSDLGADGTCHLLGLPQREPAPGQAKFILRSVEQFADTEGRCVCHPAKTVVQEGIYRPKAAPAPEPAPAPSSN